MASTLTGTWDTWAHDLAALIDVLGLHAPVVLGTSFGDFVVQRYLALHPEQPAGLRPNSGRW